MWTLKLTTRWLLNPRLLLFATFSLLVGLGTGELLARSVLGLGDPPLSMEHPDIEYMFLPAQTYKRFGHRVAYNSFSMRSDEFSYRKQHPNEVRVMVLGDSVVNGGSQTDQSHLATELLKSRLHKQLSAPVEVGNISAGSWGPPNLAAYTEIFGFFDADVVVLVFNGGDANDMPTFEKVVGFDPDFPATRPVLALEELFGRYVPRYLPVIGSSKKPLRRKAPDKGAFSARQATEELLKRAISSGALCIVALYPSQEDLKPEPSGLDSFEAIARALGATTVDLRRTFREASASGPSPYRDAIHPNVLGQQLIADQLEPVILSGLRRKLE